MTAVQARILALVLISIGIGWTVCTRVMHGHELFTTSRKIEALAKASPQIPVLIVALALTILGDMLPNENRWVILLVFVCIYALGHCLWPL